MNAIETTALCRTFGCGSRTRTAVDRLDLTVSDGEIFALLGQNGAGKTTTIRMLATLLPPTAGEARIYGHSLIESPAACRATLNLSPQQNAVARNLTVRENLALMARLWGADRKAALARADEIMAALSLADRARDRAKTLSGGLERRLSIGMALITRPRLLFLDEPTLGLDVRARRELWALIERLRGQMTVVLTTHYLEEAAHLADRIGIMAEGKLRAVGTVDEILHTTACATLEDAFLRLTEEVTA